jgi:hypothetical protein
MIISTGGAAAAGPFFRLRQTGGNLKSFSGRSYYVINADRFDFFVKFFFDNKSKSLIVKRFIIVSKLIQS